MNAFIDFPPMAQTESQAREMASVERLVRDARDYLRPIRNARDVDLARALKAARSAQYALTRLIREIQS